MDIYWGELHNHNDIGYGKGTLERSYAVAHGALLDVYAFTPHGNWKDMPGGNDPKVQAFHAEGYLKVASAWDRIRSMADTEYSPGAFVAFPAFETHSSRYGDYHVLVPDSSIDLPDPDGIEQQQEWCRKHNAIMIPHHVAYKAGWRGCNWKTFSNDVSPIVCGFSEHANGVEDESPWPYVNHSMGGTETSQTLMHQWQQGLIAGVVGSTDNHHGHPASYSEGMAAIIADELTRESILEAMRKRHTYVVSGDRISIDFRMGQAIMGDIISADSPRDIQYAVEGLGSLDYVQIIKNGHAVHTALPEPGSAAADASQRIIRIEFGWDGMQSDKLTVWKGRLKVHDGTINRVVPCFCGGDGSVELINAITSHDEFHCDFNAFTSRQNALPTSSIVLNISDTGNTSLRLEIEAEHGGDPCGCTTDYRLADQAHEDCWLAIQDTFSSPKLRISRPISPSAFSMAGTWIDPDPGPADWYLLKVMQKNRQMGYTSPIFVKD